MFLFLSSINYQNKREPNQNKHEPANQNKREPSQNKREPKITSGCVPPLKHDEREPPGATKYTGDEYKNRLLAGMKNMWDVRTQSEENIKKAKDKFEGEFYNGVEYRPFKPKDIDAVVNYRGRFTHSTRKKWEGANYQGFYYKSEWESRKK